MSLATILRGPPTSSHPLIIFQSSAAQSSLPLLRCLISHAQTRVVLCTLLYPSQILTGRLRSDLVNIVDCTTSVPGYSDDANDCRERLLSAVTAVETSHSLTVVIDSLDTLLSNLHSKAAVYTFLTQLLSAIRTRPNSQLVFHIFTPSALSLLPLITTPSFSSSLTHITAHPPMLLTHLTQSLSTPPPLLSSPEKFWNVFLPIAARTFDVEELVFGSGGEGSSAVDEIVVEVLVRGETGDASGRRRKGLERTLEGWLVSKATSCELQDLPGLRNLLGSKSPSVETAAVPDPTQNLSFNLTLTPEQQQSRTQVPLPYAYTGATIPASQSGAILYDPDSADDIDDDDPDEDLDI